MTNPLPPAETVGISPKAFWAAVVGIAVAVAASAGFAVLDWLTANPALFEALPPVVQVAIAASLSALAGAVAAYRAHPGLVVTPGDHEAS